MSEHTECLVTVVVCTRDRRDLLVKCVDALLDQTLSKNRYKISIVDNASRDDTRAYAERLAASDERVTYILEPQIGLSAARNAGLTSVATPYIAYIDDDAIADSNWLESLLEPFLSENKPAVVGGELVPVWEVERPSWLTDRWVRSYSVSLNWSKEPRFLKQDEWLCEANICFDTDVLRQAGGFSTRLGRKGEFLLSGEHFVNEIIKAGGGTLYFQPRAIVHHYIPAERLNPKWLARRMFWEGATDAVITEEKATSFGSAEGWREMRLPTSHWEWAKLLNLPEDAYFDEQLEKYQQLGYVLQKAGLLG